MLMPLVAMVFMLLPRLITLLGKRLLSLQQPGRASGEVGEGDT